MIPSVRRLLIALTSSCALVATLAAGPAAAAQGYRTGAQSCSLSPVSQPFAPWGDSNSYELAPGGDFETSAWSLSGGAQIASGSEPFAATGRLGSGSLSLPAGASAQSPATCVDATDRTMRFFTSGAGSTLVQVVYSGRNIPVGIVSPGGSWAPASALLTGSRVWGALSGGSAQIAIRFTALRGNPKIDDVFIDPWNRG